MSKLNQTIHRFTPGEYKKLKASEIDNMLDNNIAFTVSKVLSLYNGYTWCEATSSLYDEDNQKVGLTSLENRFIKILADNKNEVVTYKKIEEVVWENKDMSIFTMRNIISKLRIKTYYEIVKNISNQGYILRLGE